jgi:hypothetical protein
MRFGSGLEQAKLKAERWRDHALKLVAHLKDTLPDLWQQAVDKINDITASMAADFESAGKVMRRFLEDTLAGGISGAAGARSGREFAMAFARAIPVAGPVISAALGDIFDVAAGDRAMRDFHIDRIRKQVTDGIADLTRALDRFGGAAPKALQPYIDKLLSSTKLTAEMRLQLEALSGVPSLDALRDAAQRYGRTLDQLGPKLAQLDLSNTFDQLFSDFTMLGDAGADTNELYKAMAESVNAALERARKMGLSVPEFMRPMLEGMLKMGLLTDEFGNKLETLNGFDFSASIESSLDRIADILERIEKSLSNPILPEMLGRSRGDLPEVGTAGPRRPAGDPASAAGAAAAPIVNVTFNTSQIDGRGTKEFVESKDFAEAISRAIGLNTNGIGTAVRSAA